MAITKIKYPRIDTATLISPSSENAITVTSGKLYVSPIPTQTSELTNDGEDGTHPYATEQYVDEKLGGVYTPAGSVTFAELPALSASVLGYVYNITNNFTTTSDFVEGAGISYPAGTDVVIINTAGAGQTPVYKYDVLSGFIDTSAFLEISNVVTGEIPTGNINGSNVTFTLAYTPVTGTVKVYLDGQRMALTADYSISGTTITFVEAPVTGSVLQADYVKA